MRHHGVRYDDSLYESSLRDELSELVRVGTGVFKSEFVTGASAGSELADSGIGRGLDNEERVLRHMPEASPHRAQPAVMFPSSVIVSRRLC